jgi:hypothetical protein
VSAVELRPIARQANVFIRREGAKYALALRRISLAWRSSRVSRSSALSLAAMSLVRPGFPLSRSAFFTHSFTAGLTAKLSSLSSYRDPRALRPSALPFSDVFYPHHAPG